MDSNTDDIKGRVKEAAGDLTNNDDLKKQGQADRASGKVKDAIEKIEDKAEELVDDVRDKLHKK